MNPHHQILTDDEGKPTFAVIPWREYKSLGLDQVLSDEELYDQGKAEKGEALPLHVVKRLSDGTPPTRVYREYRGISKQKDLAARAGISVQYLSQIERGVRKPSEKARIKLANVLEVGPKDLICWNISDEDEEAFT